MKLTVGILLFVLFIATPLPSASVLTITKTPFEVFNCSVDFSAPLGVDSMVLGSVTARNVKTGANSSSQLIATSPVPAVVGGSKVVFAIQGGVNRETHLVSVKVTDATTGEKFEGQITVQIDAGF